jgi:hypothetical protein
MADLETELRFGFLVHDVSRLRRNLFDRAFKPLGITRSQWWVVAFLSRRDGMPQRQLADELDVGKVALGGLVDRLEAAGLVERRADADDRRVKRVFLTPEGKSLVARLRDSSTEGERRLMDGVSADDLEVAVRVLRTMKDRLLGLLGPDDVVPGLDEDNENDVRVLVRNGSGAPRDDEGGRGEGSVGEGRRRNGRR